VDHIAKPPIKEGARSPWKENLAELAKRESVYCKTSGMATEADLKTWTAEQLRPYFTPRQSSTDTEDDTESGYLSTRSLLARGEPVTAILAGGNTIR
jgi:hypothetical protein